MSSVCVIHPSPPPLIPTPDTHTLYPPAQKRNSAYTEEPLEEATVRARCALLDGNVWDGGDRQRDTIASPIVIGPFRGSKVVFAPPQDERPGGRLRQDFDAEGGEDTGPGEALGGAGR